MQKHFSHETRFHIVWRDNVSQKNGSKNTNQNGQNDLQDEKAKAVGHPFALLFEVAVVKDQKQCPQRQGGRNQDISEVERQLVKIAYCKIRSALCDPFSNRRPCTINGHTLKRFIIDSKSQGCEIHRSRQQACKNKVKIIGFENGAGSH